MLELQRGGDVTDEVAVGVAGEAPAGADRRVDEEDAGDLCPRVRVVVQPRQAAVVGLDDQLQRPCVVIIATG